MIRIIALLILSAVVSLGAAQDLGFLVNDDYNPTPPPARIVYEPPPAVVYRRAPPVSRPPVVYLPTVATMPQAQTYQRPAAPPGTTALGHANALRAARGLPPIIHDPALQASVNRSANDQAARRRFGHTGKPFGPGGKYEGVGRSSSPSTFTTCYLYSGGPAYGAAATVRGSDGNYYHCLQLSSTPSPVSKPGVGAVPQRLRTAISGPLQQVRSRFRLFRN